MNFHLQCSMSTSVENVISKISILKYRNLHFKDRHRGNSTFQK